MGKSVIDAGVNNQIFRKDWRTILAMRADLAVLKPVRLVYNSAGYKAGQVLAPNGVSGQWAKFSAVSGSQDADCILLEDISADDQKSGETQLARALISAYVFTDMLLDYSAGAKTDLGSKDIVDSSGISVTKF